MDNYVLERAGIRVKPKVIPPLDPGFLPAVLWNRAFQEEVSRSGLTEKVIVALERDEGSISRQELSVFSSRALPQAAAANLFYLERMVKNLLWMRGAWRLVAGGPRELISALQKIYSLEGERAFDVKLMSTAYGRPFQVDLVSPEDVPEAQERSRPLGGHLDGCRIGFDLGASDWKVASVVGGEVVFSAEFPWNPSIQTDPHYHYHHLMAALHLAAGHLPRVDAIGGSAAGIYIHNEPRVASLFRGVPPSFFEAEVKGLFHRIQQAWGVPLEVANDGEVAALAGSMSLQANRVLGISLGSSEAGGYVNSEGFITDWLDELAFAPVDFRVDAPVDEWSGDRGCGVQYFSQQAAFRLAEAAGLELDESLPPAEKLKQVQHLLERGEEKARQVFTTIGVYMGYGIAHYAKFYEVEHVLLLGRVTSGEAGPLILEKAGEVLRQEFPELAERIKLHLPDERSRRIGQAVAAASLPILSKEKERR